MLAAGPLTVKHVERDGHEGITQATSVSFAPDDTDDDTDSSDQHAVLIAFGVPQPVSDGCNRYRSGKVFVMNEAGATVAIYDLDRFLKSVPKKS